MLELLRGNDTLAFAELYNRYRHEIFHYILTIVKVPDLAEDLVQDVFVKIWDIRHRLEVKQNFRSYLFRICHNSAVDMNKQIASSRALFNHLLYHYQSLSDLEQH